MKVLVLGPQEVMPPTDGGREGIHGLLSALAGFCQVTYAYPASEFNGATLNAYKDINVTNIPIIFNVRETWSLVLRSMITFTPYKFKKYASRPLIDAFESKLSHHKFDGVLCCHPHMFELGEQLRRRLNVNCPLVLREHNIEYELVKSYSESLTGLRYVMARFFYKATKRAEISIWRRADGVAFLTSADFKVAYEQCGLHSFFVAPEGVPIPAIGKRAPSARSDNLLILLNKKATQSVSNVCQFLRTIWAESKSLPEFPPTSIVITGLTMDELSCKCSLSCQELADLDVSCVGFVPSLDELFNSSLALVSPTYVGGGIRKKVLEAMANNLPVIATPLDVGSTDYFCDRENILQFTSATDLMEAIVLLKDPDFSERISESARRTVQENASWDHCAKKIVDFLGQLVR